MLSSGFARGSPTFFKKFSPSARGARRPHGKKRTAPKGSPPHDETGSRFSAPFQRPSSPFRAARQAWHPPEQQSQPQSQPPLPLFFCTMRYAMTPTTIPTASTAASTVNTMPRGSILSSLRRPHGRRAYCTLCPLCRVYSLAAGSSFLFLRKRMMPLFRKMKNAMTAAMSTTTIATVHGQLNMR